MVDRQNDLKSWVVVLPRLVEDKHIQQIFAFANNHYAGHAPATVKLFMDLWDQKKETPIPASPTGLDLNFRVVMSISKCIVR